MRSKRCATRSSRSASAIEVLGELRRRRRPGSRSVSIHPCRLVSGVPSWCAASRAMRDPQRGRAAAPMACAIGEDGDADDERDA